MKNFVNEINEMKKLFPELYMEQIIELVKVKNQIEQKEMFLEIFKRMSKTLDNIQINTRY